MRRIKNLVDLNAVAAAILRQDFTGEYFHSFKASEAVISFEDPVAWTLDGEFGGNIRRAEIHNHRQALQIMVPNESFIP